MHWLNIDTGEPTWLSQHIYRRQDLINNFPKRKEIENKLEIKLAVIKYIIKLRTNNYMDMSKDYLKMNTGVIRTTKNGIKYWS